MAESRSTVIPALRYRNAPAAIDWLCNVFGFTRHAVYDRRRWNHRPCGAALGGGMIMLGSAQRRRAWARIQIARGTGRRGDTQLLYCGFPMRMRCMRGRRRLAQQSCGH